MKISAINNCYFNKVNFEARKPKETEASVHKASPLKAVPLAVLLAMSPINSPKAQTSPLNAPMWNFYYNPQNVIVGEDVIKNATPKNEYKCTLQFISNDSDDDNTEILRFIFEKDCDANATDQNDEKVKIVTKHFTREINFASLVKEEHNVKNEDGTRTRYFKYYIEGPGVDRTETTIDNKVKEVNTAKLNKLSMEITKEFYDELLPVAMFFAGEKQRELK